MGIDLEIKKMLRNKLAPQSFQSVAAWWKAMTAQSRAYVCLEDYLIRFKRIPAECSPDSLEVLFLFMWKRVEQHLSAPHGRCNTYVLICDDRSNVTRLKSATQAKRAAQSQTTDARKGLDAAEPYDDNVCLSDLPRVDLRRLAVSSVAVRQQLWTAFDPFIRRAITRCPAGSCFIFDFDRKGAIYYHQDGRVERNVDPHNLGEADPALIWWLHNLPSGVQRRTHDVHFFTTDTDVIPLYLLYHDLHPNLPNQYSVFWHHSVDSQEMVDLPAMADELVRNAYADGSVLSPLLCFVLVCIMSGTDLVDRGEYAKFLGMPAIMQAVSKTLQRDRLAHLLEEKKKKRRAPENEGVADDDVVLHTSDLFRDALVQLYNARYRATFDVKVPPPFEKPKELLSLTVLRQRFATGKRYQVPSEEAIERSTRLIEANYCYWRTASQGATIPAHLLV
jgi:hypothetical protein